MKKLTATAAIAFALMSGTTMAANGSTALNTIDQSNPSATHQIESRNASVEQLVAKNSGNGLPVTPADSHLSNAQQNTEHGMSLSQLQARNGATGEQTINADLDSRGTSTHQQGENRSISVNQLKARNGATGEQTMNANAQPQG